MFSKVCIITAELDERSFQGLNQLRKAHFPPERNQLDAHVTLFHQLPLELVLGSEIEIPKRPIDVQFTKPFFMGAGTAIEVESGALTKLRSQIALTFPTHLTAQDRQAIATMARKFVAAAKTRNDEAIEDIASANDVITTATGESLGELIRRGANPKPKKEEEFDLDLSKGDSGTTTPTKPTTPKPAGSQFIMRSGGGR